MFFPHFNVFGFLSFLLPFFIATEAAPGGKKNGTIFVTIFFRPPSRAYKTKQNKMRRLSNAEVSLVGDIVAAFCFGEILFDRFWGPATAAAAAAMQHVPVS